MELGAALEAYGGLRIWLVIGDPTRATRDIGVLLSALDQLRRKYGIAVDLETCPGWGPPGDECPDVAEWGDDNYAVVGGRAVPLAGEPGGVASAIEDEVLALLLTGAAEAATASSRAPESVNRGPPGGVSAEYLVEIEEYAAA